MICKWEFSTNELSVQSKPGKYAIYDMPISGIYVSEWGINLGRHTYQSVEKTKCKGIAAYNPLLDSHS